MTDSPFDTISHYGKGKFLQIRHWLVGKGPEKTLRSLDIHAFSSFPKKGTLQQSAIRWSQGPGSFMFFSTGASEATAYIPVAIACSSVISISSSFLSTMPGFASLEKLGFVLLDLFIRIPQSTRIRMRLHLIYPLVVKRGKWKSTRKGGANRKITERNSVSSIAMFDCGRILSLTSMEQAGSLIFSSFLQICYPTNVHHPLIKRGYLGNALQIAVCIWDRYRSIVDVPASYLDYQMVAWLMIASTTLSLDPPG